MASDELKIVLEDVKEKFDLVIEAVNGVNEKLDRHEQAEEERFQRIEDRLDRHEGRLQRIEDGVISASGRGGMMIFVVRFPFLFVIREHSRFKKIRRALLICKGQPYFFAAFFA